MVSTGLLRKRIDDDQVNAPILLGYKRDIALAVLCISLLMSSLDNTILNIALPTLVRDLKATNTQLEWIVDAYALVSAGLLIFAGSLGDRIGRKKLLISGLFIFILGSSGSAFSKSVGMLIFSRAVMGIGVAFIMPATLAIITTLFRRQSERALAIGIWSGTEGFGIALGPIAGGWLLSHFWWGSVFLINVPIGIIGIVGAAILIPESKAYLSSKQDIKGVLLSISGMSLLLWGIIEAPIGGWTSVSVLLPTLLGGLFLIGFILHERSSSKPMLDMEAFKNPRFTVAMASVALIIFVLLGVLFLMTQYIQFSLGYSPLAAGIRILPVAAVLGISAPISIFIDKVVGTKVVVAAAMFLVAFGLFDLSRITIYGTYSNSLIGMVIIGVGAGLAFPPATESIMGSLSKDRTGVGAATNSAGLNLGGALGVAVIGSVLATRYQSIMTTLLSGHKIPSAALSAIKGSLGGALQVSNIVGGKTGLLLSEAARGAFISGMDSGLKVGAFVALLSGVIALMFLPARGKKPIENEGKSFDKRADDKKAA